MPEFENDIERKIVEAARAAFLEKGYLGTSMRDIAKAADVNVAMVNYYFRSKDKLFDLIFSDQLNLMINTIMSNVTQQDDLFEKIKLMISNIIDSLNEHPYLPVFVITEINRNPERFFASGSFRNIQPALDVFTQQIGEQIAHSNIRPINPYLLLVNIISLCIFPFLSKPLIINIFGLSDAEFRRMQEERKQETAELIMSRLKV